MANITIKNVDIGNVILADAKFRDEILQFAGADTFAAGTILARKSVADAVTVTDGTNTGDGTVTDASVAAGSVVPLVGDYVLTCTGAVTHGGVFKLEDPNGAVVATGIAMDAATGGTTDITVAGLTFTITDGATDFAVDDSFTLTVAADGDLVPFATDGAGGAQIPLAILTYDVTVTAASDVAARVGVAGRYRKERLIIDADGDATNVTNAVIDQLRHYGLVAEDVTELNIEDNQ